jgi:hypothetical protein
MKPYGWASVITISKRMSLFFAMIPFVLFASETECLLNKKFNSDPLLFIECGKAFHFYNSKAYQKYYTEDAQRYGKKLQIGSFNMYQFGSTAAQFKDLDIVAKIINQMDVVAVTEIMPIMGRDKWHNNGIVKFLEKNPHRKDLYKEYHFPGYIKLLNKLREQDKSWSLILSAKSLASKKSNMSEYVGFYFRSSLVKPTIDEHCEEHTGNPWSRQRAYACFPSLGKSFMGDDYESFFSRRPFIGHFQSGNFDFALLASHVIYNPPSDSVKRKMLLNKFFNVNSTRDVPYAGVTSTNYARLIEAQLIMKMMNRYKSRYLEKDVIYAGDMNINADNQYLIGLLWDFALDILIDHPTTISHRRFLRNGVRTNGYSEDYDHFLYDWNQTGTECRTSGKIIDFFNGFIRQEIQSKYLIRSNKVAESMTGYDYMISPNGKYKLANAVRAYRKRLESEITIKRGKVVLDNYKVEERVQNFKARIFESQLMNDTYYQVYKEIISDHMPIVMSCSTTYRDDD